MLEKTLKIMAVVLFTLGLFLSSGAPAEAKAKKKVGYFTRVQRKVKRKARHLAKKTRRKVVKAGCSVQNKMMDSAVNAKAKVTGKKKQTFVKGHYKKGNKHHTSGHFRRVPSKKKKKAPSAPSSSSSYGGYDSGPAYADDFSASLPPYDSGLSFSKSKAKSKAKPTAKKSTASQAKKKTTKK